MKLPKVVASSVVRSTQQGESHGGVYLVDLESGQSQRVIDWNDPGIDWQGRGSDRGLRGIVLYRGNVYLAASDELFVYDRNFRLLRSFRNPYLKHCHEICVERDVLYLTSTGFNSILEFDLAREVFTVGHQLRRRNALARLLGATYSIDHFNPLAQENAPRDRADSSLHLNNVSRFEGASFLSGTKMDCLVELSGNRARRYRNLPKGTHNAAPTSFGAIYNDTAQSSIVMTDRAGKITRRLSLPTYPAGELTHTHVPRDHARQGFARGLILTGALVIGGSSPSTISAFGIDDGRLLQSVNLSKDIRNCIHGLELWPF